MFRLLAITDPGCAASTRYRVTQYEPFLNAEGVELQTVAWPRESAERRALLEVVSKTDAVVMQRILPRLPLLGQIRARARRLVYDFDDAVIYHESSRRTPGLKWRRWWRFRRMLRACDAVTAGNEYLAGLARRYAARDRVSVVPTTLNPEHYDAGPDATESGPILGWIGARSTLPYLEQLRAPLERLSEEIPALTVRVIADHLPDLGKTRVEFVPWDLATEVRELKKLRVGLAPLPDDAWTRGKCGFRLLQYLAARVPAVTSPVGTQSEIVAAGGALAASREADWIRLIHQALTDEGLRQWRVTRGRQLTEERFATKPWAVTVRKSWCG